MTPKVKTWDSKVIELMKTNEKLLRFKLEYQENIRQCYSNKRKLIADAISQANGIAFDYSRLTNWVINAKIMKVIADTAQMSSFKHGKPRSNLVDMLENAGLTKLGKIITTPENGTALPKNLIDISIPLDAYPFPLIDSIKTDEIVESISPLKSELVQQQSTQQQSLLAKRKMESTPVDSSTETLISKKATTTYVFTAVRLIHLKTCIKWILNIQCDDEQLNDFYKWPTNKKITMAEFFDLLTKRYNETIAPPLRENKNSRKPTAEDFQKWWNKDASASFKENVDVSLAITNYLENF